MNVRHARELLATLPDDYIIFIEEVDEETGRRHYSGASLEVNHERKRVVAAA